MLLSLDVSANASHLSTFPTPIIACARVIAKVRRFIDEGFRNAVYEYADLSAIEPISTREEGVRSPTPRAAGHAL